MKNNRIKYSLSEIYTELIHVAEDPLVLSCELPEMSPDEQDQVIWLKSDQIIASESGALEVDTTVNGKGPDEEPVFISVLKLTPKTPADSGFYSCTILKQGRSQTLRVFGITIIPFGVPSMFFLFN